MRCPKCGSDNIKVMDTMPGCHNNIFRRRKCVECSHRFKTVEFTIDVEDEKLSTEYRETPRYRTALTNLAKIRERNKQQ